MQKISVLEAVRSVVENHPNIKLQKENVDSVFGSLRSIQGNFDPQFSNTVYNRKETRPTLLSATNTVYNYVGLNTGLSKLFSFGMSAALSLDISGFKDLTPGFLSIPYNSSSLNLVFTQPLLKGFGPGAGIGALEKSTRLEYESALLSLQDTTVTTVYGAVLAYWSYVAGIRALEIINESLARSEDSIEKTKKLIEADEIPAADLNQLLASRENQEASRLSSKQSLYEIKLSLGQSLGLPFDRLQNIPPPSDTFEEIKIEKLPEMKSADQYINFALKNRSDYLAARKRAEAAEISLKAAKNSSLHQLDAKISMGYSGAKTGAGYSDFFSSVDSNRHNNSAYGSLTYYWPVGNRAQEGARARAEASYRQSLISLAELEKTIGINISKSLSALINSVQELKKSEEAYKYYNIALENEKSKYLLGTSTLFNIINYEDRVTNGFLNKLYASQKVANAILKLRYETGSLLHFSGPETVFDMGNFVTIPLTEGN